MTKGAPLHRLIVVALTLLALSAMWACEPQVEDRSLQRIKEAGELVVGIDPSYPPFADIDSHGQIVGYDVDLARHIAQQIDVVARFVSVDIGSIHDGLLAKKYDVIISSLPPFPEFTKKIAYSRPYFNAGQVLLVRAGKNGISSLADLASHKLGVEAASTADFEVRKLAGSSSIAIHPYVTSEAALAALKGGEIDAAAVDMISALEFVQRDHSIRIVGEPITVEPYVIAVRKPDAALLSEIDRILGEMDSDGTLDILRERWIGTGGR